MHEEEQWEIVVRRQEKWVRGEEDNVEEKEGESDEARWRERERPEGRKSGKERGIWDFNGSSEAQKNPNISQIRLQLCCACVCVEGGGVDCVLKCKL